MFWYLCVKYAIIIKLTNAVDIYHYIYYEYLYESHIDVYVYIFMTKTYRKWLD